MATEIPRIRSLVRRPLGPPTVGPRSTISSPRSFFRTRSPRWWAKSGILLLLLAGWLVYALGARAVSIPFPVPVAEVTTTSNGVVNTTLVPFGGAPVPIDVHDHALLGNIVSPDVDVSVGLVALDQLPTSPIVPNVVVKRDPLAVLLHRPDPPLSIDVKIVIADLANPSVPVATVHYGFTTPPGQVTPPNVTAELTGPITGGFVSPLQAVLETPGYGGSLQYNVNAVTPSLTANLGMKFDPVPDQIKVSEQATSGGLSLATQTSGPNPDVKLDATAQLSSPGGATTNVAATIDRLPQSIAISDNQANGTTAIDYETQPAYPLAKPDITATYTQTPPPGGGPPTYAHVYAKGVPASLTGTITSTAGSLSGATFSAGSGQVDAVDFLATNYLGAPPAGANIPPLTLEPQQFVSFVQHTLADGSQPFQAAGRIIGLRSATFTRVGPDLTGIHATASIGDGATPLRVVADLDNRAHPGTAQPNHTVLDSTISPLPNSIDATYQPGQGAPTAISYTSSQTINVTAHLQIADQSGDSCGAPGVTCVDAQVFKVPSSMKLMLPGANDPNNTYSFDDNGATTGQHPDVFVTAFATPDATAKTPNPQSTWVKLGLLRIPNALSAMTHSTANQLDQAEFHGCDWNYSSAQCATGQTEGAIGRITFTARDSASRDASLPAVPSTVPNHVVYLSRNTATSQHFEASGRVDEVSDVVFHQLVNADGTKPGILGATVKIGNGTQPFDLVYDDVSPDTQTGLPATAADQTDATHATVHVNSLPASFGACLRSGSDAAPPTSLPPDPLLAQCERTDVLGGSLRATPTSLAYTASAPALVSATYSSTAPNKVDDWRAHTTSLNTTIDKVPTSVRADVITPISPNATTAARNLKLAYTASSPIDAIDLALQSRRADSFCADPRSGRLATCATIHLRNLPSAFTASYNPDPASGAIDFTSTGSDPHGPLSLDGRSDPANQKPLDFPGLTLSSVSPGNSPLVANATIDALPAHMTGQLVQEPGGQLGAAQFNGCPDGACSGIGSIDFTATDQLNGNQLGTPPPGDSGVTQSISYIARDSLFQAAGSLSGVKRGGISYLDGNGNLTSTAHLSVALGKGDGSDKLRAYVDRQTSADSELADTYIDHLPAAMNVCLRGPLSSGQLPPAPGTAFGYCDTSPGNVTALQALLTDATNPNNGQPVAPNIDVRTLRLSTGGGASVIEGPRAGLSTDAGDSLNNNPSGSALLINGLGSVIDAQFGGGTVDISGPQSGGGPGQIAQRVSFDVHNFDGAAPGLGGGFPFGYVASNAPNADRLNIDPASAAGQSGAYDDRGTDGTNDFVRMLSNQRTNQTVIAGSIPAIRQIATNAAPCDPSSAYFPNGPGDGYSQSQQPSYTCVKVAAANGQPLGLQAHILKVDGSVIAVDNGFVDHMPTAGAGLQATLASAPAAINELPVCDPGVLGPPNCQPPQIAVVAPRDGGAAVPNLQARLAIGSQADLQQLSGTRPLDPWSQRLDYTAPPSSWGSYPTCGASFVCDSGTSNGGAIRGIRLMSGSNFLDGQTATLAGINIDLHRYFNIDPSLSYSCSHQNQNDTNGGCKFAAGQSGSHDNQGFSSSDSVQRIVMADNHAYGSDVPYLGRLAQLSQDFSSGGDQSILTGAQPTQFNGGAVNDDPHTSFPEQLPTPGTYDYGADIPGYFDIATYTRNQFDNNSGYNGNASSSNGSIDKYTQIDARVNSPFSLGQRMEGANGEPTGTAQSGLSVPGTMVEFHDLPGLPTDQSDPTFSTYFPSGAGSEPSYLQPTARVQVEQLSSAASAPSSGGNGCSGSVCGPPNSTCYGTTSIPGGVGSFLNSIGIGANLCYNLPSPTTMYTYLQATADPQNYPGSQVPSGGFPSRTIQIIDDGTNHTTVQFHGLQAVNAASPVDSPITGQVATRAANFNLGFGAGGGIGIVSGNTYLEMNGDLLVRFDGLDSNLSSLVNNSLAFGLLSNGGPSGHFSKIGTYLQETGVWHNEVCGFFGAICHSSDWSNGPYHQGITFTGCSLAGYFSPQDDEFDTLSGDNKATISFDPLQGPQGGLPGATVSFLTTALRGVGCLFGTDNNDVGKSPAPSYTEPGDPVPGVQAQTVAPPVQPQPAPGDLTIPNGVDGSTKVLCGNTTFNNVVVKSGGQIEAGYKGETLPSGQVCDGSLQINAQSITVDSGGSIVADGAVGQAGSGTSSSAGSGGGHDGGGGAGGAGGSGGGTYGPPTDGSPDPGSPGQGAATQPTSVQTSGAYSPITGAGGGAIQLIAANTVNVAGSVSAVGANGATNATTDCSQTGGGGGSGGGIALAANEVDVSGAVNVGGGNGGDGGNGGGGGGGGRVGIRAVIENTTGLNAGQGSGGAHGGSCTDGANGADGNTGYGAHLGFAGTVSRPSQTLYVAGSTQLQVNGLQQGGGPLDIITCELLAPNGLSASGGLSNSSLNPDSSWNTAASLISHSHRCQQTAFGSPTSAGDAYQGNVTFSGLADGYYGYFAFAAQPPSGHPATDCTVTSNGCTYQTVLPTVSNVFIASDSAVPVLSTTQLNGSGSCPDGAGGTTALCLDTPTGELQTSGSVTGGAIVTGATCTDNGGAPFNCGPGITNIPLQEGLNTIAVTLNANSGTSSGGTVKWFVDTHAPSLDSLKLAYPAGSGGGGGWFRAAPTVSVTASDAAPSSGLVAIQLTTDDATASCGSGTAAAGSNSTANTSCAASGSPSVPANGTHTFSAQVSDGAGNSSAVATSCTVNGGASISPCQERVDTTPPGSQLVLEPNTPDGSGGWYTTQPTVLFNTSDNVGGSGVDPTQPGSGVFVATDQGIPAGDIGLSPSALPSGDAAKFTKYDPSSSPQVLGDGVHQVCWYAVDVAGNGENIHCTGGIKVDSTAPVPGMNVSTTPSGSGWYLTVPTVTPTATDPTSGVASREMQIDGGGWQPAAPVSLGNGTHTLEVRATDSAGNLSTVSSRVFQVDTAAPAVQFVTEPSPNSRGWYRQPVLDAVSVSDGPAGSGPASAGYVLDGGASTPYTGPFAACTITGCDGQHTLTASALDVAGNSSSATQSLNVETQPPVPVATGCAGPILLGNPTRLWYSVTDPVSPSVKIEVDVFDVLGNLIARIPVPGLLPGGYTPTGVGSVLWDGTDFTGTGVLPGTYYYRVEAINQAGISADSGESPEFPVILAGPL